MQELFKLIFSVRTGPEILRRNWTLFVQLLRRNVESRYRGSMLGLLWSFFQPLMMLTVYTFIFTFVFKSKFGIPMEEDTRGAFSIIMFCGMAVFNIFSESVNACCTVVSENPNFVKKVIFPLEILPIAKTGACVFFGLIWFFLLLLGVLLILQTPSWTMMLLPLTLVPLLLFSAGIGFFAASIGVFLRDLQHILGVFLQVLFFMTPIFYPLSAIPERFRWVLQLNPLCWIVEQTRELFLYGHQPDYRVCALLLLGSAVVFQLGLAWFLKTKRGFADVL